MAGETLPILEALSHEMLEIYKELLKPSPLMEMMTRHLEEKERLDREWLASLSPHARKVELTKRRIAKLESRFRAALDFHRYEEE